MRSSLPTNNTWIHLLCDGPNIEFFYYAVMETKFLTATKKISCLNEHGIQRRRDLKTTRYCLIRLNFNVLLLKNLLEFYPGFVIWYALGLALLWPYKYIYKYVHMYIQFPVLEFPVIER